MFDKFQHFAISHASQMDTAICPGTGQIWIQNWIEIQFSKRSLDVLIFIKCYPNNLGGKSVKIDYILFDI